MSTPARVLIVDDEENIRNSLTRLFKTQDGLELRSASSANQALKFLEEQPADVIISDERMPGTRGNEFLAICKEQYPDSMRILLTAYSDSDAIIEAVNKGEIYRYLKKPWNNKELLGVVHSALELIRLRRQNAVLLDELQKKNSELEGFNGKLKGLVHQRSGQLKENMEKLEKSYRLLKTQRGAVIRMLDLVLRNAHQELSIRSSRAQYLFSLFNQSELLREAEYQLGADAMGLHCLGGLANHDDSPAPWRELASSSAQLIAMFPGLNSSAALLETASSASVQKKPLLAQSLELALETEQMGREDSRFTINSPEAPDYDEFLRKTRQRLGNIDHTLLQFFARSFTQSNLAGVPGSQAMPLEQLLPGMVLANPVYLQNGNMIVLEDTQLTAEIIQNLRKFSSLLKQGIYVKSQTR